LKGTRFSQNQFLSSCDGGVNFAIGNSLGLAVLVEKKTPGILFRLAKGPDFTDLQSLTGQVPCGSIQVRSW
jgi:hypothetical protein